jgi:hypothetical protein
MVRYDPATDFAARELRSAGRSRAQVARRLGIHPSQVDDAVYRADFATTYGIEACYGPSRDNGDLEQCRLRLLELGG